MRAVRQGQGESRGQSRASSTTPSRAADRARRGTQPSPAARSSPAARHGGGARLTTAATPPARTPKAEKELAEWRELRGKARRREAEEAEEARRREAEDAEEARRLEQKLRWENAAAEERLRQQMEYVQHSPFLNDPQLSPHARLATPGAPSTPQGGGRLAELPASAAASLASSPAGQRRRLETTQPNYWRDQLQRERLTVQRAQHARAQQEAAMVLQASARRRQGRHARRRAIAAARDEQRDAAAYEDLVAQVRAAVARRLQAKGVLVAGERGRRARRRAAGMREQAEEQRALAQQYDFLIEDVKGWVAEQAGRRRDEAATVLQAFYRGNVGRRVGKQEWRQKNAATLLQTTARGKLARNAARGRRDARRERQWQELAAAERAAVTVQSHARGTRDRRRAGARREAALCIQHTQRRESQRRREARQLEVAQRRASTTIQCHARRHAALVEAERRRQERDQLQRDVEGFVELMSAVRRWHEEKLAETREGAATRVQAGGRGAMARRRRASLQEERDELIREAQAFAEQMACVRAECERLQDLREAGAATRLQAHARGGAGRRCAVERRAARSEQEWLARGYEQLLVEVPSPQP